MTVFHWSVLQYSLSFGVTVTFLPSFLLAIISTLDLTNKKSLSILISHPYLVLLPTFTYFSYSKLQCGDRRIALSAMLSILNMVLNALVPIAIIIIFPLATTLNINYDSPSNGSSNSSYKSHFSSFFGQSIPFLWSISLSIMHLYLENILGWSCCGYPGRVVKVFDPDHPHKTFMEKKGRVVEMADLDVEFRGQIEMTGMEEETGEILIKIITLEDLEDWNDLDVEQGGQSEMTYHETGEEIEDSMRGSDYNLELETGEEWEDDDDVAEFSEEEEYERKAESERNTDVTHGVNGKSYKKEKKEEAASFENTKVTFTGRA